MQPPPIPSSRTFSSPQNKILYPLSNCSPYSSPSTRYLAMTNLNCLCGSTNKNILYNHTFLHLASLISLNIFRFIHVIACIITSLCVYTTICLSINGHLDCFYLLGIVLYLSINNSAAMNISVCVFICLSTSFPLFWI